jgi:hypothetical protein
LSLILKAAIGGQVPSPIKNGRCSFGSSMVSFSGHRASSRTRRCR